MQKFDEIEDANEAKWAIQQDVFKNASEVFLNLTDLVHLSTLPNPVRCRTDSLSPNGLVEVIAGGQGTT